MRKSFPRLFTRSYRLFVVCIILTGLIGFGISASSHSGGASDNSQLSTASNAAQPGQAAGIIASVFNFPMPVPSLTATMADSFPTGYDVDGDGKADVGDKIRYTVTINNSGTDANNLTLQDTIDPNTTLINGTDPVTGGLNISPVAKNDSYNAIGNTELAVGTTAVGNAFSSVSGSVKDNDVEYLGDTSTVVAITNGPTTQGGTVNMETDGNFTYLPPVNFTGSDTFTYTLTDDGLDNVAGNADDLSDTATVTITVANRVWYVDNSYTGANGASDGRSTRPFVTLVTLNGPGGVGDSDSAGDVIYVFTGSGNYTTGIQLESSQALTGNGVALVVNATTLRAAGTRPTINNAAGDAVNVSNISGVVIRGFNLQGSDNAVEVATSGANNGGVEIADNVITGAGTNGIDITGNGNSGFTLTASVHDNTITATGNGIDIFRQGGNVNVTAFDDNVILGTTGGVGINVLGSGGSVLFDADPATGTYNTVSGGNTVIGATGAGNGVGLGGMVLTNVRGDLSFTDLDIWTDNGTAFSLLGSTPNFLASGTGTRVTANSGSPTLVAVSTGSGGAAVDVTDANINLVPTTMSSTNSTVTGVSLVRTSGTFTAPSGATITNATGTDFSINGNSNANANVNVTYPGTITDDTGALVTITNVTASSTHTFSGAITDNFDGDGGEQGISMTGSTGANVTFSGGLNIRTTTLAAFTATGGGTVTITDPAGAPSNKLQTTSGTPLTVSSTNIGASGLTFESIAANGAANGIFLSSTGSSGGLTVTGDGTNTTKGGNASGGTIQNINGADASTNGIAIYLNNTRSVVLRRMTISGTIQNMGVYGELVNGLTMQYCTVGGTIGTTTGSNDLNLEVPVAFGKTSPSIANGFASGSTNTIDNCLISGGIQHNVEIFQQANAFNLTISNSNITNNGAALGSDGINIETHTDGNGGTTRATATIAVSSCLFDNNKSQALQANALGDSFLDLTLSSNTVQKTTQGNEGFVLQNGGDADMVLHVTGNNMSGLLGNMLHVGQVAGNATSNASLTAFIQNNVLTQGSPVANRALTVFPSTNFAAGFVSTSNILLDNNQVTSSTDAEAFFVSTPDAGSSPAFTATVTNNTVTMTSNTGNAIRGMALQATQGSTSNGAAACFDVRSNVVTYTNGAPAGINGIRVRQANPGGGSQNPTVQLEQGSSAGAASTVLAANNPGSTTEVVGTVTVVSNSTCQNPPVSFFNTPNNQREYFAQAEDSLQNSNSQLLASVNNDLVPVSELIDRSASVSKDSSINIEPQQLEALSAIIPIPLELASTEPASVSAKPEIEKSAFALAHGKSNQTSGDSLSSFVSAFVEAVAPTAHAATAPPAAPMPVLEVNKNIGTLPAGESITVVFDVLVDSAKNPHPVASYTNQMTIKADGMSPDVLTDDTPGTAAPNEPTVTPGDRYNTSTALSANPTSPAFQGDSVTFTAVVTPTEGSGVTPNGTVQFKDGASNLGSPVTCSPSAGNTCTATFNTSSLTAATHNITAEYSGGTNHDASTSNTLVYVVNPCTINPVVLNTSDGTSPVPAGSLREAVTSVCTGNTITFDPSVTGQINLVAALPNLSRNMTITGPGADVLEVRGSQALGNSYRVFNITNGTVNISGLTLSNGADALGGGGVNNTSTLTLTEVTVKSNTTTATGGGIQSSGTLNIIRSTVSNNVASLQGGGIYNTGNLSITNSTISTNTANVAAVGLGGGIYSTTGVQTVTIASSTIASNSADASGGGIYNAAGAIDIGNTIAADNTATASPDLSGAGTFNSNDYNLIESSTVVFTGTTTHHITGVDPSLGALTDNGGPTFTHALLHGSAAIDQGNTALTVDQRNQPREVDNPNVANVAGGDGSDIGAYEAPAPPNAPDLDAASDTGASNTDNVTSDNTPTFTISGVTNGATVDLLLDGNPVPVATGTAAGTSIQLTSTTVGEGVHTFTARQTVAGGTSPNSTGLSVTIDTVAPTTPTIDLQTASDTGFSNTDNITNAASLSFDIGNTEAGALVELLRDGNPVASVTSAGGTVVLADTPPKGSFTYSARQTETAGGSATSSGLGVGVDRTGPSVSSITRLNTNPTTASSVGYTVTFDQPVTGVDATDFTVTTTGLSGAGVNTVTGVAPIAAYTVTVNTGTGDGTLRLDVTDDDSIADVAGNVLGGAGAGNGNFTTGEVYTVDKTAPSVLSIVRANANPTNAASVDYTVTFSENVTGVDTTDFDLNNSGVTAPSITGVTGSNNVYTVSVNTGTGDGTIRLDFSDNDSVVDGVGNPVGGPGTSNGSFTGEVYTVDKTAPTINIGAPSAAASNGGNVTYTITYVDANFNTSTLTTGNITLNTTGTANATVGVDAGSGTSRTVTLSGITGNGTLGISIAAGTASDTAGNTAPAAGPSTTFIVDTIAPTVSSIVRADANPTSAASVNFTVTFSEGVTGVGNDDFTLTATGVTGASVTGVTFITSSQYTVAVNTGTGDGTLRLDVTDNDSIVDQANNPLGGTGAGNGNFTTGEVYTVDKTDPSVSSIVRASANPTNAASVNFTVTFSEGVTGVDTGDFTLTTTGVAGASVSTVTPVDSSNYTVAVNTGTGDGTIRLDLVDDDSIIDQASKPLGGTGVGNGNFITGEVYTVDKTAPTINIGAPSATASNGNNVTYTVTYVDANFNTSTLTTGNITLNTTGTANATVGVDAGNGDTRTVTLSGITGNGTLGISIAAGTASDTAGNTAPAAGPSTTFIVDTIAPTVQSIVRVNTNPTTAATVDYTVTFSENVTGVDTTDFTLTTTGVTSASVTNVTGSNNVYTVTVNTGTGDGTLRLDVVDDDTIVDQANNPLGGTGAGNGNFITGEVYSVDKNVPTVNITAVTPDPRNTAVSDITIVFSEPITGFDLADLSLTRDGGANLLTGAQTLTSGDNITWTLGNLSGITTAEGTYTLTLTASGSGITDNASNALSGDASDSWVMDTTAPTVTIEQAAGQADPVLNASAINFTAVFSEPVTGFDSADITFSGAGSTTATVTEIAPNDGTTYNVQITGMNTSGIVTASVNANAAQDAAGNLSAASTSADNQVLNQQDTATAYEVNSLANTEDGACSPLGTGPGNQDCTLREAIAAANLDGGAPETITFAPALTSGGPAQITLDGLGALPDITDSVTITGPTNNRLTISGNLSSRIFSIAASQTVNISYLTFINGRADIGGAIYNLGALTIRNSTFTGNAAIAPFGDGGAIDSDDGNLTVINSTISGNTAVGGGGGIHHCGSSTGTLINVTITGNRSDSDDAGPGEGGGLDQVSSNPITLINTIVAGNFKGTASPVADDIAVLSGFSTLDLANSTNNLVGDAATSGGLTDGTNGNIVGNSGAGTIDINTVLQTTLASNGGPTQTHLLWPGSPAVNAGSNCVTLPAGCAPSPLTTDQRGTGYPRLVNVTVDIGAVEVNYEIAPIAGAPQSAPIGTAFATASKVTVTESGVLKSGIPVTFAAPGFGPSGTFPGGVLTATVNSDVNGIATSPILTANNIVGGPYTVTGTLTGSTQSTDIGELNNTKIPAQITLSNLVQTYDGTSKVVGIATSPAAGLPVQVTYNGSNSPPVNAGTYAVVATIVHSDYEGQALATFIVNQLTQTITFGPLPNKALGDADFTVNATSSAGLPVSFSASGSCTVSGNTVHLTNAGFCTITASQAGTVNYSSAPPVSQTFTVSQAGTTTTVTSSANPSSPGQTVTFTATVSSAQGTPTGTVQFVIDGFPVGAPVALNGSGVATFSTSTLTVGNHTVIANYAGAGNFATSGGTLAGGQQVNINPGISINDVSLTEGDSGAKNFDFTVTLSQASNVAVTVNFATANGTATLANSDYQSNSGTVTFNPGDLQKTITVAVNGDLANEPNETFFVNLSNAQNSTISDNQGLGTILNDDAPGVVFSSNAFSFAEGAGHGDVIVTRTGDTTQPLAVDYQTSDQSAMTPCQTNNTGFASDRCDYGTASGTLHFAAGETQKTIPIVLVNDAYVEGPEQLSIKLTNPVGGTLGSIDTATVTITDNDTQVATTNPISNLDFFLRQLYLDFFGREPDAAGFNFWKSRMTGNCPAGQTCDRADTALRFFESDEFDERGFFIYVFYHASLGRRPTYSEWILEVSKLNGFQTPAEQQAARDAFIQRFMNTQEFMNLYNGAQTGQTFVDALIQKSGVNPASRQTLINNYNTVGRAETLKAFMATPEIQAAFNDPAFVAMLYYGLLRRDAEPGGFDFWMQQLIQSNHNYRQLIGGFLDSDEYWFRFAQIQSNHPNP